MLEEGLQRIAAFTDGARGGNPAGILLCDSLPDPQEMQRIAADVGYSETAFAAPSENRWRVRYFAPAAEVPFCGHATIALAAALALRFGSGTFHLELNHAEIIVEGRQTGSALAATLQSPPTHSQAAPEDLVAQALNLFSYDGQDLDPRLPPAIIEAGARHLLIALRRREDLAAMRYAFATGARLMSAWGFVTISLVYAESATRFHARNPFASGGVYEDPATGAAAAAFAGYLRDVEWPHEGGIEIIQGEDMGVACRLHARIPPERGSPVSVSGEARLL